ncbi:MAG: hypothetical protein AABY15_06385 [Nanoarchaeota archaeon]
MAQTRTEKILKAHTSYLYSNRKLITVDGKIELQCSGYNHFCDTTFTDAFDSDGKFLKEIIIGEKEYKEEASWLLELPTRVLVQINYDFHIIPVNNASSISEICELATLLDECDIFDNKFGTTNFGSFRNSSKEERAIEEIGRSNRNEIPKRLHDDLKLMEYQFSDKKYELCFRGNHVSINSDAHNNFDADIYTENYKNALIKFPQYEQVLNRLYFFNLGLQKWLKTVHCESKELLKVN